MTASRPDLVDEYGVRHRYGCETPGWLAEQSTTMPAVVVLRCSTCGALRLHTKGKL